MPDKSKAIRSPALARAPLPRGTRTAHLRHFIAARPLAPAWLFLQTPHHDKASLVLIIAQNNQSVNQSIPDPTALQAMGGAACQDTTLGLLTQQPMSGYDIKRFLKGLNWLIGSPSGGSLYPALCALRQAGLVTMEIVPGLDRPPRKIYSVTEAGHQALQAGIEEPIVANATLRAFVLRLLLADSYPVSR